MPKVVLSTNYDNNYLFFLPLTTFMWKKFGFDSIVYLPQREDINNDLLNFVIKSSMPNIDTTVFFKLNPSFREDTQVQTVRLLAANSLVHNDEYLLTGDIDMFPLTTMWYGDSLNNEKLNLYGHDLTGYTQYPICYVGARAKVWKQLMDIQTDDTEKELFKALDSEPKSRSEKWEDYWGVDQDILTKKVIKFGVANCIHYKRGHDQSTGLPLGRVDRHDWERTSKSIIKIDAHLLRPGYTDENFNKILDLMKEVLPNENLDWVVEYRNKFIFFI